MNHVWCRLNELKMPIWISNIVRSSEKQVLFWHSGLLIQEISSHRLIDRRALVLRDSRPADRILSYYELESRGFRPINQHGKSVAESENMSFDKIPKFGWECIFRKKSKWKILETYRWELIAYKLVSLPFFFILSFIFIFCQNQKSPRKASLKHISESNSLAVSAGSSIPRLCLSRSWVMLNQCSKTV